MTVTLTPVAEPPPTPAALVARARFGDDEWAGRLADGRVLAFLREPVARCHLDRLLLVDGERRSSSRCRPWIYYGSSSRWARAASSSAARAAPGSSTATAR